MSIDKAEWQRRFAARIMEIAKWPEIPAIQCAESAVAEMDDMWDDYKDDPEGAADEEMSNWTDDGDE
jgi:hypothetical protein